MWLATAMFAVFSGFLILNGLRTRSKVKRLREELDILEYREVEANPEEKVVPSPRQLPLPRNFRARRSASA